MQPELEGIHHVTAIAGDPQRNVDFYVGVLGLRLVKRTVNFDDPGTYHLYYGDELGRPGTILTFFPWPGARRGSHGAGQATVVSFSVAEGSLGYWQERLRGQGLAVEGPERRFEEEVLSFRDPDGLQLELVAHAGAERRRSGAGGPIPERHALRGFHSVTLSERDFQATAALLTGTMGLHLVTEKGQRFRLALGGQNVAALVDVVHNPEEPFGRIAAGTVHHVAWRCRDDAAQQSWRSRLIEAGFQPTPVLDRNYFHSIYFREPGGVLFEIATDPPGFAVDEPLERLGGSLMLPPWLEHSRAEIEAHLPALRMPTAPAR